ncbi:response regulator [Salibacterium sp. K-3]
MVKVVIAEDDFRVAGIHEKFVEKVEGVQVIGKTLNGEDTIQFLKNNDNVDILLLDIYMPDYLGTDLIQKVRDISPMLDIIIITAAQEKSFLEESLRKGVFNYLIKPVTLERFIEVISEYKERQNLLGDQDYIDQGVVDKLFSTPSGKLYLPENLPKGIDSVTLSKVARKMQKQDSGWTAEDMGHQIGASRTTARRYLEYLVSIEKVGIEQEYGMVGRPERKYYLL